MVLEVEDCIYVVGYPYWIRSWIFEPDPLTSLTASTFKSDPHSLQCSPLSIMLSKLPEYTISKLLKYPKTPKTLKSIHSLIIKLGLSHSTILITALINNLIKSHQIYHAHNLFDELPHKDMVAWTSMVVAHAHIGFHHQSLSFFRDMIKTDITPNGYSFSGALIACLGLKSLKCGKEIHAQVLKMSAFEHIDPVVYNGLVGTYSRCGALPCAQRLFNSMQIKGIVTWNEMMSGYLYNGENELGLKVMVLMVSDGIRPDEFTYAICIDACSRLASMWQGIQIHACVVKDGYDSDLVIRNSLLDMYAKCGCVASAKLVFDTAVSRDLVLWTTMISAIGKCGFVREAIAMFEKMGELKIERDEIAYLAVLSACSHGGLVNEGWHYFHLIAKEEKTIFLTLEHYGCMVDLLSRSGRLDEAMNVIERMPLQPSVAIWSSILSSCRMYGNAELGQFAASRLLELDPVNESNWVVLSGIHACESDWVGTWRVRESMKGESVKKEPGCSWVELNDGVHVFLTADRVHPEVFDILRNLNTFEEDSVTINI